jgi:hypothetical protein
MRNREGKGEDRRRERKRKRVGQNQKRWQTIEKKGLKDMTEHSMKMQGSSMA